MNVVVLMPPAVDEGEPPINIMMAYSHCEPGDKMVALTVYTPTDLVLILLKIIAHIRFNVSHLPNSLFNA
jgi:hypothetical protein